MYSQYEKKTNLNEKNKCEDRRNDDDNNSLDLSHEEVFIDLIPLLSLSLSFFFICFKSPQLLTQFLIDYRLK